MSQEDQQDIRALLTKALEGEPPATINTDRLVRLGRRRARTHRATALIGVMTIVGAILLGATLIRWTDGTAHHVSTATTSQPTAQQRRRLDILTAALLRVYPPPPGISVVSGALRFTGTAQESNLSVRLDGGPRFNNTGLLTVDVRTESVLPTPITCGNNDSACTMQSYLGEPVQLITINQGMSGIRIVATAVRGRTIVLATADNFGYSFLTTPSSLLPPISQDQLALIAASVLQATD